jgi:hypothetical protein
LSARALFKTLNLELLRCKQLQNSKATHTHTFLAMEPSPLQSQQPSHHPSYQPTPSSSVPPSRGGPSDPIHSAQITQSSLSSAFKKRQDNYGTSLLTASMYTEAPQKTGKHMSVGYAGIGHIEGRLGGLTSSENTPEHKQGPFAGKSNVSSLVAAEGGFTNGDAAKIHHGGAHVGKKGISHFDGSVGSIAQKPKGHRSGNDYYTSLLQTKNAAASVNLSEPPTRF